MQVKFAMSEGVECAQPGHSITHAAQRMRDLNVGSLPVCGDDDQLVGIITDRDITIRAVADCCDPEGTFVREVMSPGVTYCFEDDDVQQAAHLMEEQQIRRLIVLNDDKRLVGILSLGDLAVRNGDDWLSGEALERISEPAVAG
jgi:CBS domain-containing protein